MNNQKSDIPDSGMDDIQIEYEVLCLKAEIILTSLRAEIAAQLQAEGLVATIKTRVKTFQSYYLKRIKKVTQSKSGDTVSPISDVLGLRVVCPFLEDLSKAETMIQEKFEVIDLERKGDGHSFDQFGYSSTHFLVSVPPNMLEPAGVESPSFVRFNLVRFFKTHGRKSNINSFTKPNSPLLMNP